MKAAEMASMKKCQLERNEKKMKAENMAASIERK
jgi:hypothetical protein